MSYTAESQQSQSLRCSSLVVCDDYATPLDTCQQHQPQQHQQQEDQKVAAPRRARAPRVIYSKTVLILMRPKERHSLYVDRVTMRTGLLPLMTERRN